MTLREALKFPQIKGIKPMRVYSVEAEGKKFGWVGAGIPITEEFDLYVSLTPKADRWLNLRGIDHLHFPVSMNAKELRKLSEYLKTLPDVSTLFVCNKGRTRSPSAAILSVAHKSRSRRIHGKDILLPMKTIRRTWLKALLEEVGDLEVRL